MFTGFHVYKNQSYFYLKGNTVYLHNKTGPFHKLFTAYVSEMWSYKIKTRQSKTLCINIIKCTLLLLVIQTFT